MKNGGVGWDVNLPVKIFSLLTYSSHLQLQNTSNRGFSRLGVFQNTSNPSFSVWKYFKMLQIQDFHVWKPRKTVIRVEWRLSGVVAALLYNFSGSSFSKQFLLKKKIGRQGRLFGRKKLKREATTVLVLTFWEGCQNQKIYFWIVWPSSSLDKYFWHPCQKASPRLAFHYSNSSLCVI